MKNKFIKLVFVTLIIFSFTLRVAAPDRESLTIVYSSPVEPYKKLIHAIGMVETKCDTWLTIPLNRQLDISRYGLSG